MLNIFDFNNYKHFLRNLMPSSGQNRGLRSKLANALGCQLSFLSIVLSKPDTHLSLEHGKGVCEFFELGKEETIFFILLLSKARAGSKTLESFYDDQIKSVIQQREQVRHHLLSSDALPLQDQAQYYSEWFYAAIHMALRKESNIDVKDVAAKLGVSHEKFLEVLSFFERTGIVIRKGARFEVGNVRLHIDDSSPWLGLHHRNWRQKSIQFYENRRRDDLNYTAVTSISENVANKIRALLLESIKKTEPLIREASDEVVYNLNIDFQRIL